MKVNFDNLRRHLICSYDRLAKVLESNRSGQEVEVSVIELKDHMDSLRQHVATIACCYEEKAQFKDVLGERILKEFAPEE